jgi:UDP-N-acetylglucosamine--N-acetylmuramyl-(pentapeptide) pyrophosphoryl-undecaprenol N-acetylglucosamine transferase
VLFAAGYTAGHVLPALVVADHLKQQEPDAGLHFAATADGFEHALIRRAGFRPDVVRAAPVRGGSIFRWPRGLASAPAALTDASALVRRIQPDVVIGTGGYLSGGVLFAAAREGIPTLLIELNVLPGLANRWATPFVDLAAVAWPATAAAFGSRTVVTGAPVRAGLFGIERRSAHGAPHVLVLGGSLGAPPVNRAVAAALPALARSFPHVTYAHQTGASDEARVRAEYERAGVPARVASFFHDVVAEYARADLVIAAAGGMTCAELAAAGRPAVLIPLAAAGRHQRANAAAMDRAGAAVVIDESALTPEALINAIAAIVPGDRRRASMAAAAAALARPGAAEAVSDLARQLAGVRKAEGVGL